MEVWIILVGGRLRSGILGVYTSEDRANECVDQFKKWFPKRRVWIEYSELDDELTKSQMDSVVIGTDFDDYDEEEDEQ